MTKNQLTVAETVKKMEPQFALALPKHIPSERFTRVAMTAVNSNPDIAGGNVNLRSVQAAVMSACQDGLVIDGREAALVVHNTKNGKVATYIPMVSGLIKKMRNTGEISTISTGLVYQREFDEGRFEYIKGDTESLRHEPILFGEKGDLIGVYAVVTLKDGQKIREFMDMKQIEKVRGVSRAGDSQYGPWTKWFEEMCEKSVLRKVSKKCPMATDLDKVFARGNDEEDAQQEPVEIRGAVVENVDPDQGGQTTAAKAVKKKAAAKKTKEKEAVPADTEDGNSEDDDVIDVEYEDDGLDVDEEDIPA